MHLARTLVTTTSKPPLKLTVTRDGNGDFFVLLWTGKHRTRAHFKAGTLNTLIDYIKGKLK